MHSAVTEFKPQTFALAYPQPMPHMMGMGQERPLPVGADTALRVLQGCPQPDMGPEGGQGRGFLLTTPHSTGKRVSWGLDTDLLPPVPDRCWDPQLPLLLCIQWSEVLATGEYFLQERCIDKEFNCLIPVALICLVI